MWEPKPWKEKIPHTGIVLCLYREYSGPRRLDTYRVLQTRMVLLLRMKTCAVSHHWNHWLITKGDWSMDTFLDGKEGCDFIEHDMGSSWVCTCFIVIETNWKFVSEEEIRAVLAASLIAVGTLVIWWVGEGRLTRPWQAEYMSLQLAIFRFRLTVMGCCWGPPKCKQ